MTVNLKILLANFCQKNFLANDELQENRSLYNVGRHSKATAPLIGGESEHAIGCPLTCTASKKASIHRQTLSCKKERIQETL